MVEEFGGFQGVVGFNDEVVFSFLNGIGGRGPWEEWEGGIFFFFSKDKKRKENGRRGVVST